MVSKRRVPPSGKPEPEPEPEDRQSPSSDAPEAALPEQGTELLEQALEASFPDLVIVDGELELTEGVTVDVVGLDSSGHALFVCVVDGAGDATVLRALDLVRGLREHQDALYRHLDHPTLRVELPPLAVLVADAFESEVLARLACLGPGALWCLERRTIRSRASASTHLVPVLPQDGAVVHNPGDPTEFCRHLAPEHRDLGLTLVARLTRIDDHLEYAGVDRGVRWSLAGEAVCRVCARDGRLEGSVAPHTALMSIDSSERLEGFVEEALGRALELLDSEDAGDGEGDPVRVSALDPSQPILTAEEIEAFREM